MQTGMMPRSHNIMPKFWICIADADGNHVESTWINAGHGIQDLQETLYQNHALPSLKGASSSAIGFVSHVPAMGYATYFIGPTSSSDPQKAMLSELEVSSGGEEAVQVTNKHGMALNIQGKLRNLQSMVMR